MTRTARSEARRLMRDQGAAEDAAQQALERAWRYRDRCATPQQPGPWVRRIAQREALRLLRSEAALPGPLIEEPLATEDPALAASESAIDVRSSLAQLKEEVTLVLFLHYWCDLSCRDVATLIDIPVGTVKIRLFRGRSQLLGGAMNE